jgi:hypothetical protein
MAENPEIMPLPLENTYETCEQAIDFCQGWAREHGYAVLKSTSKKVYTGGPYITVFLQCDRGDSYKSTAHIRKSRIRATGCPFKLQIKLVKHESLYKLIIHNPAHNHSPSWSATAHAIHR